MIERLLDDGRDYLIEGSCLRPDDIAATLEAYTDRARGCFLGNPELAPETKAAQVGAHAGGLHDWLGGAADDVIFEHVERNCLVSVRLRDDCLALGLRFFDTGGDFPAALDAATAFLTVGRKEPIRF